VERWNDVLAIRDVIDRYATALDRRDWDHLRSCFTTNCRADYEGFGSWTEREPLVAWLDTIHRELGPTLHRITNHQIEVDRDRARATSYLDALLQLRQQDDQDLLHVVGKYVDELIRTDEGWRISDRLVETLWRRREKPNT
jgi:3-phenylpropionate/cinnamic acid dioxygenase small subunit